MMSEEKQEGADLAPAEVTPEVTASTPVKETAEIAPAPAAAAELKKKKIRRMTLPEVDKRLEQATLRMGGDSSLYVRHLRTQKKELENADSGG